MEEKINGNYLRLVRVEDRMNWQASLRWQQVIWLILGVGCEVHYISTGIKRESVRFSVDYDRKGKIVWIVGGGTVAIHSRGLTIFGFTHIAVGADEEVVEVAGGVSGIPSPPPFPFLPRWLFKLLHDATIQNTVNLFWLCLFVPFIRRSLLFFFFVRFSSFCIIQNLNISILKYSAEPKALWKVQEFHVTFDM